MIAETKINETFPENQLSIDGNMPSLRADRNQHGRDLLIYKIGGVSAKEILTNGLTSKEIEVKVVVINLYKIKSC